MTNEARPPVAAPAANLLRDPGYRRLWLSVLAASLAAQVSALALPLAAAVMLGAGAMQMGWLAAAGSLPFVLFLLPAGVWLDRARALPVYLAGEALLAAAVLAVPVAWAAGALSLSLLYGVAFVAGSIAVTSGIAGQILLARIVPRERLVEAHGKSAFAGSLAEIAGPGLAGALVKLVGAPLALLANAVLLAAGIVLLRRVRPAERRHARAPAHFRSELASGVRFVAGNPLLVTLALAVGAWQVCQTAAMVVPVLLATRELGLGEAQLGLCYAAGGLGTVLAGVAGHRLSRRIGPGPCLILGFAVSGAGWLHLALAPTTAAFVVMLACFGGGTALIFMNLLALRQAVTPLALLGRMTGVMRWLTLLPAAPGALLGGYLAERWGLRHALAMGGAGALLLAAGCWRFTALRRLSALPAPSGRGDGFRS